MLAARPATDGKTFLRVFCFFILNLPFSNAINVTHLSAPEKKEKIFFLNRNANPNEMNQQECYYEFHYAHSMNYRRRYVAE